MQSIMQTVASQIMKTDLPDRLRRLKRSFEANLTFRKTVILVCISLAFFLYFGPTFFGWLFGYRSRIRISGSSCVNDKTIHHSGDLDALNGHIMHKPHRPGDSNYLPYIGNGYFGLSMSDVRENLFVSPAGHFRTLTVPVSFQPVIHITSNEYENRENQQSARVVNFVKGLLFDVVCYDDGLEGSSGDISLSRRIYAHRAIPEVLVQEIKITNPTGSDQVFQLERQGITNWPSASSSERTIEHGDGNKKYAVISGVVPVPSDPLGTVPSNQVLMVSLVVPKFDTNILVKSRMTHTLTLLSSISYSKPMSESLAKEQRQQIEKDAVNAILQAASKSNQSLREDHLKIWRTLWTTGFGISHSMAEDVVNGAQVNATIYYVLSQVPTPLHSIHAVDQARRKELESYLAYLEGCYGGLPTLQATNLWKSLSTPEEVNRLVSLWILTLHKNGCHQLVKAGADGVIQAMVLSFAGLVFKQQHLELNSHPKDLHRDYMMRRVGYGNATHLNMSVIVGGDNKAIIQVALDRQDKDYFACDAGCLDAPVQLSTQSVKFPVKLTDPVTAVLYITSDYQHMQELKHTIHVKEVVDAPAHEHHVMALHKHGNKLGGLPTIFWFSIGFLIFVFHMFLFKLVWQEYCASNDRFRSRKHSDFE